MLYRICGEQDLLDIEELLDIIGDEITENVYDEYLDDCNDPITLFGIEYSFSTVLKRVDEVMYRCSFLNFQDAERTNIKWEIEQMEIDGYGDIRFEYVGMDYDFKNM